MSTRTDMLDAIYTHYAENDRLVKSRNGQLEYQTTLHFIHQHDPAHSSILEIGAGTGRYSIALAREGYTVSAIELVQHNLEILKQNATGLNNLAAYQGDALDLSRFADESFDMTLVLGPMYHLYCAEDHHRALDEAIRVTKRGGIIMVAFLSIYGIMFVNYLQGNFQQGLAENYDAQHAVRHFEEQAFTGFDICEFESLFADKNTQHLATVSTDSVLELAKNTHSFAMSDEEFSAFFQYHLAICDKREILGASSHLLYICQKNA